MGPYAVNSDWEHLHIFSPSTGRELGLVPTASPGLISETISKAVLAQPAWAARRTGDRADTLEKAATMIDAQTSAWSRLLAEESGKVLAQAEFELKFAAALTRANAQRLRFMGGDLLP